MIEGYAKSLFLITPLGLISTLNDFRYYFRGATPYTLLKQLSFKQMQKHIKTPLYQTAKVQFCTVKKTRKCLWDTYKKAVDY